MAKVHVHIKVRESCYTSIAIECAKFIGDTANAWSLGAHELCSVFIFTCVDLPEGVPVEVTVDIPTLPSTAKGLSIVGQQWFEDTLHLREKQAQARTERAKKAAAARWGSDE